MADESKPETPAPKIVPQTGEATAAAAASTRAPAAGATASAPATGANPAATPHATTTPAARPAPAPRPPAAPIPDLAGKTTNAASPGGAAAKTAPAAAAKAADARRRRHLAAAEPPRLDGPGMGRVFGRLGRRAGRDRPLHVPERAQRAAAAVQGRLPERVRHGRRRAVEREVRRLARADDRGHRAARERLLFAQRHLHAPGLHAELSVGGKQVQVPVPRQRLPHTGSTSRGRRRARSSARASCWPKTGRSWSTRAGTSSASWGSGRIRRRF